MTSAPVLSESTFVLCVALIALVPLAALGLALINTGLGRSRSAAHTMLTSLCVIAIAAITYVVFGFAWQGAAGGPRTLSLSAAPLGIGLQRNRSSSAAWRIATALR